MRTLGSTVKRGVAFVAALTLVAGIAVQAMPQHASAATATGAMVRYLNAAPGSPAVDLYVDGKQVTKKLAFGKSTDFGTMTKGSHDLTVTTVGQPVAKSILTLKLNVADGTSYDVVLFGTAAKLQGEEVKVDLTKLAKGMARIRVVHLAPDAGNVDVAAKGGKVLFADLKPTQAAKYIDVPAGTVNLEVRPTGKTTIDLALKGVKLEAGKVYDIFAIGQVKDKTLAAVELTAPAATS